MLILGEFSLSLSLRFLFSPVPSLFPPGRPQLCRQTLTVIHKSTWLCFSTSRGRLTKTAVALGLFSLFATRHQLFRQLSCVSTCSSGVSLSFFFLRCKVNTSCDRTTFFFIQPPLHIITHTQSVFLLYPFFLFFTITRLLLRKLLFPSSPEASSCTCFELWYEEES